MNSKTFRQGLIDTLYDTRANWLAAMRDNNGGAVLGSCEAWQVDALVEWLRTSTAPQVIGDEGYRREMEGESAGNESDLDLLADLLDTK